MLNTNCEFLHSEIMDIIRAFYADGEDYNHYFSLSGNEFLNVIEYDGKFYDFKEEYISDDEIEIKRLAKRSAKLAFYNVLSKKYGELPWGSLTGIRPTKLAYAEKTAGRDFKELFEKFGVFKENVKLVESILHAQVGACSLGGSELYVGIPFCPSKCDYCSFITAPLFRTEKYIDAYIESVIKEIKSVVDFTRDLRSIYIGGGTPFSLPIEKLTRIYAAINEVFPKICEYTVEAGRPDVFSNEKLKLSKDFGVTRICVNPQSFNDITLEKIGRLHTSAQTLSAFECARKFEFDINLDLIAGLADERVSDFEYSLKKAIELRPENITVHTLSLKSGAKLKENVDRLDGGEVVKMIKLSRELLSSAGYTPYYLYRQKYQAGGLENVGWALDNKACLYNVGTMEEISNNIAVGAGAISKRIFSDEERIERYASPKDIPTYIEKLNEIIERRKALFSD